MGAPEQSVETANENTAALAKKPAKDPLELVRRLCEGYDENEQRDMMRHVWLTLENKTLTAKNEDNRNVQVKYNPAQALAYVLACRELKLSPIMSHVIMLEGQFYITLQGHLQNAHASGTLIGLETKLTSDKTEKVVKKWYKDKPDTTKEVRQYTYECVIRKAVGQHVAEFKAEGIADATNVANGEYSSDIKIRQMAEARAMRRCLARAFPVGLGNFEDVQESITYETVANQVEEKVIEATKDELMTAIESAPDMNALESLKDDVKKSGKNSYVAAYAKRVGELNNPQRSEPKEEPAIEASETIEEANVTE